MALHEGAAPGVLPGEPDQPAVHGDGPKGEELAERPVDPAGAGHGDPALQHGLDPGVRGEPVGKGDRGVGDPVQHGLGDGGVHRRRGRLRGLHGRRGVRDRLFQVADLGEHPVQLGVVVPHGCFGGVDAEVAAADEGFGVEPADGPFAVDDLVHQRVRHRRVVALVVAAPAVADHVDDDVPAEGLPVFHGQPGDPDRGLRVVAVDVEDRRLHHFRDVGAVLAGPGCLRCGGEPDLVVDDHVHGAAGAVPAELGQLQGLGDHALPGERGVAVDGDGQHGVSLFAEVELVLFGPGDPFQDGVDDLEMGRVRDQGDVKGAGAGGWDVFAFGAQVVFHVTGALGLPRVHVALELAEDHRVGLADDVGQHVEPAAVGHPDDGLVGAVFGGLGQRGVQQAG